jgi:predicted proteasome-type protease
VTLSDEAADFGITEIPEFKWLVVSGRPGEDDFGILANGQAIISEGVLRMLQSHTLDNCDVEPFSE